MSFLVEEMPKLPILGILGLPSPRLPQPLPEAEEQKGPGMKSGALQGLQWLSSEYEWSKAEWGKGWGLVHWKSNPRHFTNGALEDWSSHLPQGCHGRSKTLSLCSPEWDPGTAVNGLLWQVRV